MDPPSKNHLENQGNAPFLHREKSRKLFSFLLDSDIEEANDANMVYPNDDENVNIEL